MNNLYIGLLRLENRAAFFVLAKASQVTPRKTAEERFHTLARGWLAYPVTPRTHIYRRRAVVEASREAHFVAERRHPHVTRYAERSGSVPGLSHLPLNCVPEARHFPINNALCHAKNRRRAVSYVSTGLACLPRDANNTRTATAEERL